MFDETNENSVNAAEEAQSQPQNINPYLAGAGDASAEPPTPAVSPIPEEPQKKDNAAKIVVAVLIVAVIALIAVIIFMFTRKKEDPKELVEEALEATFEESGDYLLDVWNLEQYEGMFEGDDFSLEADLDAAGGIDINMLMQEKSGTIGFDIEVGSFGLTLGVQGYVDDSEVRVALPGLLDYVFTIDRETLSEDIWNLVDEGMLDEETAEQIIALNEGQIESNSISPETAVVLGEAVIESWTEFYDKASMEVMDKTKELEFDGKDRECKGYLLTITYEDTADFIEEIVNLYMENEEFRAYLDATLIGQGYSEGDLAYAYGELEDTLDDFYTELRENGEETVDIEFYLYDGKLAQVYSEIENMEFEWNVEGGNFPLENTSLTIGDRYSSLEFSRTGSVKNGEHRAKYCISNGYDEYVFDIRYDKKSGEYYFDFLENDYSLLFVTGSLEKVDDSTLKIIIDDFEIDEESVFDGTITITNECDDIERPEGEEREVFFMDEDDWNSILYEILYSLY